MPLKSAEEIHNANSVNLPEFLISQGENLVRSGRGYRLKEHNSLFIQENRWYWNSRSKGGNNVKFIMEYYGKTFPEAVDMLNGGRSFNRDYTAYRTETKPPTIPEHIKKEIHIDENRDCRRAIAYLTQTRKLDYNMITDLIKQGKITQDLKGNAVFKIIDENGITVGAELVGTSTENRFKGIAPESAYGYGFEVCRGKGENALFFESSIDMLSYLQSYSNELDNHRLISMIGVKPGTVENTIQRYGISPENTYLCADNDTAGNNFVARLKEKYPQMHRICTVNPYKDWNEQLKLGIKGKTIDFSNLMRYNKGDEDMDVNVVKTAYTDSIGKITSSAEEWEKFLRFSAHLNISEQQQKHNFSSKLLVYSVNPNVTDCKTFSEWKSENNSVAFGSKGIPVLSDNEKGQPVVTHVFDVLQTNDPVSKKELIITPENQNAVMETLINTYGYADESIENIIVAAVHSEVENMGLSNKQRNLLEHSICFEVFEKFGLDMEYDYGIFEGIEKMSVRDIAEIGVAMNEVAVSMENLIENTITQENERSISHGELHQRRGNGIHMERGSETALPDVQDRGQPDLQTGYRNLDLHSNDDRLGNSTGGNRKVWSNEASLFGELQESGLSQYDMGEQPLQSLHTDERGSSEPNRENSGEENGFSGVQGSNGRLHEDNTAPQSVSNGSGRGSLTGNDILINNNVTAEVEDKSASAFSVLYDRLTDMTANDELVINAVLNSDNENLKLEIGSALSKYALSILHEDIMANVGFYNDFMTNVDTRSTITDNIVELAVQKAEERKTKEAEVKQQVETVQHNSNIEDNLSSKEDIVTDKEPVQPKSEPDDPFKNTNRSKNGDIILGNTKFRYIPQKTYTKVDKDIAAELSKQLEDNGVKFSGVIKDDIATFTVSKSDLPTLENIKAQLENHTEISEEAEKNEGIPVEHNSESVRMTHSEEEQSSAATAENNSVSSSELTKSDNTNKKNAEDIEIGDVFRYKDEEYTITHLMGIYPNDVGITQIETTASGMTFNVTKNIDKYVLADEGEFLGNSLHTNDKSMEQENAVSEEHSEPVAGIADNEIPVIEPVADDEKISNSIEHRNFVKLQEMFPKIMNKEHYYEHFENPQGTYEPLSVEWIGKDEISVIQTYEQNGDLMRDPDIVLRIDEKNQTASAISYENSGLGRYEDLEDGSSSQKDTDKFMGTWLNNLESKDLQLVRAAVEYEFENEIHTIKLSYDDGKIVSVDGDEKAVADYIQKNGIEIDMPIPNHADILEEANIEHTETKTDILDNLKVGDCIGYEGAIWRITELDDFKMDLSNTDVNANNSVSSLWGWRSILKKDHFEIVPEADVPKIDYSKIEPIHKSTKKEIIDNGQLDMFSELEPVPQEEDMSTVETIQTDEPVTVDDNPQENIEKETDVFTASNLNVGDIIKLHSDTAMDGNFNSVELPETYAVVDDISDNGISFRTFTDESLSETNGVESILGSNWNEKLEEKGFGYIGKYTDFVQSNKTTIDEVQKHSDGKFHITDEHLGEVGAKQKFKNNVEAIRTLKAIETEDREATPEEQEILSKYVGWGGLQEAFDGSIPNWNEEYNTLRYLLTDEEYEAARSSTQNAFYTSPVIIEAMYNTLENMGFKGGEILEPSMGVGNFFGMLPDKIRNESNMTGVELDSISGRIARQLYPEADITISGFEKMKFANNQFDLAVGNVPFGDIVPFDKTKTYQNLKIHDYFFAKTVDKVRPGGIVAFITSSGTLDKQNSEVRKMLASKCELLGAIRLPNTAFKKNAGTEVTSDIIFLQKRDKALKPSELSECNWINIGKSENGLPVNEYFVKNPQMVLGTLEADYRGTTICKAFPDKDIKELLSEAIKNINGKYTPPEFQPELDEQSNDILTASPDIPNYTYTVVDDKLYYRRDDDLIPLKDIEQKGIKAERRKGMCEIADTVKKLLNAQVENMPDEVITELQKQLNDQFDSYTKKYGHFNKLGNKNPNALFRNDVRFPLLQSLEKTDGENFLGKADIFTKRTITPHKAIDHADTSSDALIVSLAEKAKVDIDFMSELTGFEKDKIISDLHGVIYPVPELSSEDNVVYQTAEEYLSGNIYEKLEQARMVSDNPAFAANVEALEKAKPEPLKAGDIEIKLGATWVDPKIIQQFMYETFDTPVSRQPYENKAWQKNNSAIEVTYSDKGKGEWNISNKFADRNNVKAINVYGTKDKNAYELLENILNMRTPPKVYKKELDGDGKERAVVDQKATALVSEKVQMIKNAFSQWVFKDPERREQLVNQYNEQFNCIKPREYDGSHLSFVGMNPEIQLREHQKNAIAHALFGGNTLFAHEVGAGKTFEMIASAMEGKRLGLHTKSLICVPNHLTEQIGSDFMKLYHNANILVAKPEDFSSNNRRKMCSKIATGNFDAVIIGHSQLIKIPISSEREQKYIKNQINEITAAIEEAMNNDGESFTVKQMEKTKSRLTEKFNRLVNSTSKDQTVTFEELGIDKLIVDEAHLFKNLYVATKMSNISGISSNDNVQKTQDLYMKCQYLDEITNNRGTIFSTGTPVSNSMTELFCMQKYLQSELLQKLGLNNFDSWAANFGDTVTAGELAPEGNAYRMKTRFAKFMNVPELMNIFKQCADIKTADMLNLDVPECVKTNVCVEPTEAQAELIQTLSERAKAVRDGGVDPTVDNMLTITNDGRKIGLDQRLINPLLSDDPNSKVNACINNVFDIWKETAEQRSTQLIFCDLGVPQSKEDIKKNGKRFSVYDDIKQKLIAKGVPENEIAFIHDAGDSEIKKAQLFAKVRNGEIRVLIGSTPKMGAGTNVQTKLIASHDLDCPWKPAELVQRAGRMIRQGNENPEVRLFRYVTNKTFDAYLFQTLEKKQNHIGQIMTSKAPARKCEDVDEQALDYAEIKALCAGDPRIKERMELEIEVSRLKMLQSGYLTQKYDLEDSVLKIIPKNIASLSNAIEGMKKDIQKLSEYVPQKNDKGEEQFIIKLDGKTYTDKETAGEKLLELCTKASIGNTIGKPVTVGEYKGFPLAVSFDSLTKTFKSTLQGSITHTTDLGQSKTGNFTRLDNLFNNFEERLESMETNLSDLQERLEKSKLELGKPFEYADELSEKEARLIQLTAELENTSNDNQPQVSAEQSDSSISSDISEPVPVNSETVISDNANNVTKTVTTVPENVKPETTDKISDTSEKSSDKATEPVKQNSNQQKPVPQQPPQKHYFSVNDLTSPRYASRSTKAPQQTQNIGQSH